MTTDILIFPYSPLVFLENTHTFPLISSQKNNNAFYKLGKGLGKTVSFLRKDETKTASIISYWAVETVLFAAIMLTAPTLFVFFSALFLYLYGTYALFSAAMVLL